jgi:hypothetical protein
MPATIEKTYSHRSHYSFSDLNLRPHRKNECRIIPGAYTPKSASIKLEQVKAHFTIDYGVSEPHGSSLALSNIKILFGKHTKKVLEVSFEYSCLDQVLPLMQRAAAAILDRQKSVSQDSIKRNYQMASESLTHLRTYIEKDLPNLLHRLSEEQS